MSSSTPPTFNVGIFIPSYWVASTTGFDKTYADNHYLKFPVAQGTEYMTDLVVSGGTTLAATSASSLNVSGKTTTANIDLVNSSSTLDMKSGSITNLTNINGVSYPQAAGINAVLATGNSATNKTIRMNNTNDISIDGDNFTMTRTINPNQNTAITYNGVNVNNSSVQSTLSGGDLKLTYNTSAPTINYTELTTADFNIVGSSTSITNTLTSISNAIADATYTGTLTSNALNLFTNSVSTLRNAITNSSMTITGSTTSITNTLTSATNIITDGTRTITSGIVSSVATFKALASSGGNSTIITPNSIYTYVVDGATTAYSQITGSNIVVQGATNINATINSTNYLVNDATNSRYAVLTSGGYATSGNSINSIDQQLYLGSTAPSAAATSTNSAILTPTQLSFYNGNSSRGSTFARLQGSANGGSLTINRTSSQQVQAVIPVGGLTADSYMFLGLHDLDLFTANANVAKAFIQLTSSNTSTTTGGSVGIIQNRTKTVISGDYIGMTRYMATTASEGAYTEFGRISGIVKNVGISLNDGSILFETRVNSVLTQFLELNGDEVQINAFKPLDMNNNSIVSSTGGITLDATGSSGTGSISITPKSTGYIILSNLPTAVTGLPTGALYNSAGVLMVAP